MKNIIAVIGVLVGISCVWLGGYFFAEKRVLNNHNCSWRSFRPDSNDIVWTVYNMRIDYDARCGLDFRKDGSTVWNPNIVMITNDTLAVRYVKGNQTHE